MTLLCNVQRHGVDERGPRNNDRSAVPIARANVYDVLAQALSNPAIVAGAPRQSSLAEAAEQGASVLGSTICRRVLFALEELPPVAGAELRRRYARILAQPGSRPLATYESLALTGRLAGQAAQEVGQWFRLYGLEADGDLSDSASAELAFMGSLAEAEAEALLQEIDGSVRQLRRAQRQFLHDHVLSWLPQLGSELAVSGDPYIGAIGRLLEGFLKEEQVRTARPASGVKCSRLPRIQDGDQCCLCGFCVQTCPTGALWVTETDTETSLMMAADRCTGCARCLPECPESVLYMAKNAEYDSVSTTLFRSPRTHCPQCGQPTVSQAEMEAVFARLEADSAMQLRLSLCNSCKVR